MVDKQQCDRQRSGLLLFLFYIGWWFHKVEKIMATGSNELWRRTSKPVITFLMVSMLALVNMAAVEARTVTIDLDQLKDGDESEVDGWSLETYGTTLWLEESQAKDVDTYIIKGNATKFQITVSASGKKCIFQGNVTLRRIHCSWGTFTIELQGKLTVRNTENKPAIAIGSESAIFIITGPGTLDAIAESDYCPGIGSLINYNTSSGKPYDNGTVIIKSGTVNATGGRYGCGIGSGGNSYRHIVQTEKMNAGSGGTIRIEGGTVNATGNGGAAGIGGGFSLFGKGGQGGNIIISGGTVNVTVTGGGAGIGGGSTGITLKTDLRGGLAGNYLQTGGTVTVHSEDGAGIGSAAYCNDKRGNDNRVQISGGSVTVTSTGKGAGIGGGYAGWMPDVWLTSNDNVSAGTAVVKCTAVDGAGIGGGMEMQSLGDLNINAKSVDCFSENGAAIGGGKEGGSYNQACHLYGGNVKAYSINGFGVGEGANSYNRNSNHVYLGNTTEYGKLNADIHSVNNYAIDRFLSYYGTSRIKSDTKAVDMDNTGGDSDISDINGGSVYMSKPMAKVHDNYGVDVYQVKVRAFGLSNDRDYLCSYIVKKAPVQYQTRTFYARPINGYFYFWMCEDADVGEMTINGEKVYVDVVKNNHNNLAPTIVYKKKAATDYYYFSIKEALDASTENDVLTLKHDYPLLSAEKNISTKNITFDMNGHTVTSDGGGVLEINSGLFSIKNGVSNTPTSFKPAIVMQGGYLKKIESSAYGVLNLPEVTLKENGGDKVPVYWTKVSNSALGTAKNFRQGTTALTDNQRSFSSASTYPYYFWLVKGTADEFSMDATPLGGVTKYYYADVPAGTKHGDELDLQTYKALIENASSGTLSRYKTISGAFSGAADGQTVKLIDSYAASNEVITLPQGNADMTFDLQTYTLSGDKTIDAGNHRLTLTSDGSGKLEGTTTLGGLVYTEIDANSLGAIKVNGQQVYRTTVTNLPTQNSGRLTYRIGNAQTVYQAGTNTAKGNACLWLPANQQAVTLSDVLPTTTEQFAEASLAVAANHSNTVAASPLLDIGNGTITITPNGTGSADVTYGSKSYVSSFAGTNASKRIAVYGTVDRDSGKDNRLVIASGSETAYLSLNGIGVQTASDKPALEISAPVDIELIGDNRLKGSYNGSATSPAVQVNAGGKLTWKNCADGSGRLYADGGTIGANASPAVRVNASAMMSVSGGTLVARHGNGKAADAIEGGTQQILAGSVDALYKAGSRPKNNSNTEVYKVSVTTGLTPDQPYTCTYKDCSPGTFMAMPDAAGKVYCWQPEQELSAEKTKVVLTHPVSFEKTEIEVVQVEKNDDNVAPIVLRMTNDETGTRQAFGNLQDAFAAMEAGTESKPNSYSLQLLTRIANLRTVQSVPAYTRVALDLGSFEIAAQNGSDVSFDASANGAFLRISGKGNIKNTFRIKGDVFIAGVVPLTDAVVELDGKAVFRTLVKDLPAGAGNGYVYSYGEQQNVSFYLHDGQACLWLPDYGRSEELRFTVSGAGGSSTEYTAGNITTVTQRTEAIPATPVGVVARVIYQDGNVNLASNTLQEAFKAAATASLTNGDVKVQLLTGVTVSGTLRAEGKFALNLNGKNLVAASGARLQVADAANVVVNDETTGAKGSISVDIDLLGKGQLFVSGSVRLEGNVTKGSVPDSYYWRTLVNMSYQPSTVEKVTFEGADYPVIDREVCLWLPASDDTGKTYTFTVGVKTENVTGYLVSAGKHDNDMTIGGSNNEARIGTQEYATLKAALDAAQNNQTVELMKAAPLTEDYSLAGKNITLELGKYELTGDRSLTVAGGASLVVKSRSGSGKLGLPLLIGGGNLYIGQDIPGGGIGAVGQSGNPLYRLLVTNLPANIPTGTHQFTYAEIGSDGNPTGTKQTGSFMVRESVGCLWLEEQVARRLTMTVGGSDFPTENVTVNDDHFNIETYGVNDVAQIRNGKKYRDLADAFKDAAGKTIVLLKNAALKQDVEVGGAIVLEIGEYTITSQEVGNVKAQVRVPATGNLQITGKGSISSDFAISKALAETTWSNGNLQVDGAVVMTGSVKLDGQESRRVSVSGLSAATVADYEYKSQRGKVKTASDGSLCLWMNVEDNTPANFFVEAGGKTYMATSVLITGTHVNPVNVTQVTAVAAIGDKTYDTLADAFAELTAGTTVSLRKSQDDLTGELALPAATTGTAVFDLGGNALTATGLSMKGNNGQLLLKSGSLGGLVAVDGKVYADGSVVMNNAQVSMNGKTVWRTFLTLPDGTASFSYRLGEGTPVTSANISVADGHPVACLWLPSSNVAGTLTVTADNTEYALNNVIIASTHGNELDATSGNDPVAEVNGKTYASIASALSAASDGGIVVLKKGLNMASVQDITKNLTFNLGGYNLTSGNGGFNVVFPTHTLTLTNGMVLGTVRLKGEGTVYAGSDVKIAGIVLDKNDREVYRTLVKMGPSAPTATGCRWIERATMEYDLPVTQGGDTYEVTVPVSLADHNTVLTAYKRVELTGNVNWKAEYANTNLLLASGSELVLDGATGTSALHRLTLSDGASIKSSSTAGQVVAEEGIRYVRVFANSDQWESVALPFTTTRITTVQTDPATATTSTIQLTPATGTGTAGNFWLKTVDANGRLEGVTSLEMTANVVYLMAVPSQLAGKEITFVSGPNQLLRRNKVAAVKPAGGFAAYANGTFDRVEVKEACYLLNADGDAFELKQPVGGSITIDPFRGYLLADANTTAILPTLRVGVATDVLPVVQGKMRISALPGRILVDTPQPEEVLVYTFMGSLVRRLQVPAGQTEIPLARGFYIVNRMKIWVKE